MINLETGEALHVTSGSGYVLLFFCGTMCAACDQLLPKLVEVENQYKKQLLIIKIDADDHPALTAKHGVRSIPQCTLMRDGQLLAGFSGNKTKGDLTEFFSKYILNRGVE
jgi:thioredoxin-like negative regulator of GroEL